MPALHVVPVRIEIGSGAIVFVIEIQLDVLSLDPHIHHHRVDIGWETSERVVDIVTDVFGIGLGMAEPSDPVYHGFLRVAHMGHVNAHMTLGMLAVIDAGLKALNIPHGEGAIEAASRVVSEA